MSKKVFQVAAILDGATPRKDGGMTLRFVTQEISKEEMAEVMSDYYSEMGFVAFSKNEVKIDDIPTGNAYIDGGKSPSKRLKDRMFVCYKGQGKDIGNFDQWYTRELERLGNQYLERVPR